MFCFYSYRLNINPPPTYSQQDAAYVDFDLDVFENGVAGVGEETTVTLELPVTTRPQFARFCESEKAPCVVIVATVSTLRHKKSQVEVAGDATTINVATEMRTSGVRLQNCRKNKGKASYSLNSVCRMAMPDCYKPPELLASGDAAR